MNFINSGLMHMFDYICIVTANPILAACYQLAQSALKIGSALAQRVG